MRGIQLKMDAAKTFVIVSLKYNVGLYKEFKLIGNSVLKDYKVEYLLNKEYEKLPDNSANNCLYVSSTGKVNAIVQYLLFPVLLFRLRKIIKNIKEGYVLYYNFHPSNIIVSLYFSLVCPNIKQVNFIHSTPGFPRNIYSLNRRVALLVHDILQAVMIMICKYVVLPSEYSFETFRKTFQRFKDKSFKAHLLVPGKKSDTINNNKKYFSYIGHINNTTGFDIFINLVKFAIDKNENFEYCIATSTLSVSKYLDKLDPKYLSHIKIINKSYISDSEIEKVLDESICLFKFVKFVEQSGNIPFAYSYGTAVIGSSAEGIRQDIKNGITGYTIDSLDDMPEIINKMRLIQNNIKNISVNCRELYKAEYSQESFGKYYNWL